MTRLGIVYTSDFSHSKSDSYIGMVHRSEIFKKDRGMVASIGSVIITIVHVHILKLEIN